MAEGDEVEADQVLLRLDAARQRAAVTQTETGLLRAQNALAEVKSGPRPEEIEADRAAVEAAQAQLDLLDAGARPEMIAGVEAEVVAAEAALEQVRVALVETELYAPFGARCCTMTQEPGSLSYFATAMLQTREPLDN